jgi:hypothetical protein
MIDQINFIQHQASRNMRKTMEHVQNSMLQIIAIGRGIL